MAPCLTFSTGSLYLYSLDRCFALAAEYGFDGMEIMCDSRLDTRQPDNLRRLMDTYGIPVRSLHAPFLGRPLPGWEMEPVAVIKQTVALAEQIGAGHVVVHLPGRIGRALVLYGPRMWHLPAWPHSGAIRRWMADGGLARFQTGTSVKVCVENMPILSNRLKRLLPALDQKKLIWWNTLEQWPQVHDYLTMDTTHWATHGIDPLTAYRAGNSRIRHIHLSNFRDGKEHQLPHRGELDLAALLRQVAADGFDGHIVLELNPQTLEAVDEAKMRRNLAESAAFCREALNGVA